MRISDWSSDVCSSDLDDDAVDTEPRRVMRNTLRVVAGRHRGDAGSAFGVAEAHQLVERTTLLERRGELEILEFDPDLGTGDLRQHTRMRARRADQLAIHDIGGATDIVERNRQLHSIDRKSTRLNSSH